MCTALLHGVLIPILVFLSSICPVLDAAFDLFASRHSPRLYKITSNEAFHADSPWLVSPGAHHRLLDLIFILIHFPSGMLGRGRRTWLGTSAGPNWGGLTPLATAMASQEPNFHPHSPGKPLQWLGVKPPRFESADVSSHVLLPRPNTPEGKWIRIKMRSNNPWWAPGLS